MPVFSKWDILLNLAPRGCHMARNPWVMWQNFCGCLLTSISFKGGLFWAARSRKIIFYRKAQIFQIKRHQVVADLVDAINVFRAAEYIFLQSRCAWVAMKQFFVVMWQILWVSPSDWGVTTSAPHFVSSWWKLDLNLISGRKMCFANFAVLLHYSRSLRCAPISGKY